jgi:regulator of sigma E protease
MVDIIYFIFVLGLLIFVHELGHFAIAKWVGIRVEQFSLGFPPKMVGFQRGETEYRIGWIPLGGYVKMAGERPDEADVSGAADEFMSKRVWQRTLVILAGPTMNYILAVVILAGIYFFQGKQVVDDNHAVIGAVVDKSPAQQVGLQAKDEIIAVDDSTVTNFSSLFRLVSGRPDQSVNLTWLRGTDTLHGQVTTWADTGMNMQGKVVTVGRIGIYQDFTYERLGLGAAMAEGFNTTNGWAAALVKFLKDVLTFSVSSKLIGGPLFIAQAVGQAAQEGFVAIMLLAAILSVNLCLINLVPIPALDGGQLMFLVVEKIKGSPVSMRTRAIMQQAGFVALIVLIIFVTRNDIWRIMNFGW